MFSEPDAAAFLGHVQQHAALLLGEPGQRLLELLAAVAAERMEDVAGQALGVDAHEHVLGSFDLAADERDVVLAGQLLAECDRLELAVRGRQMNRRRALDELLVAAPVFDEIGDGDQLDVVTLAELDEVGDARHRPVLLHHLADDACGIRAREPCEVDRGFRLARPLEHAAFTCAQREDMAGLDDVDRTLGRVDRDLDRARAILRRDPSRDAFAGLDRDGECRLKRGLVAVRHLAQPELVAALFGQWKADQAAGVHGHEVDRLGRCELGCDRQVALVLAVGRIDDDHELPLADVLDRVLDRGEDAGLSGRGLGHQPEIVSRSMSFSTYLASTSTSRLTSSPGSAAPSVVTSSVCGISATSNASPRRAAIVSETPSTAIEPFSTQ